MAKGKPGKKEKAKRKKDDDKKIKENELQKEKETEDEKNLEADLELARKQILQRQETQRNETCKRIRETEQIILKLSNEQWDEKIWNRYLSCDGRPLLDDIPQLNSFISNWINKDSTLNETPDVILEQCDCALELLLELQQIKYETENQELKNTNYNKIEMDVKSVLDQKLNVATFKSLLDMSATIDPDTGNSYIAIENKSVIIGIWANLVCNPRYNGVHSSEIGVGFTVPRDIVNSECAVRIMKTKFDNFSPLSDKFRSLDVPSFPRRTGLISTIPSQLKKVLKIKKVVNEDWDEGSIDLKEFFTVGPILSLELVVVPSQPHKVKNWIMTKIENEAFLKFVPWNCTYVPPSLASEESKKDEEEDAELEKQRTLNEMTKLVSISWKLSGDLIFSDVPRLARWDSKKCQWTTSGLIDVNFKEESSTFSFFSTNFGAFAVLLPKFVSLPYQTWELIPIAGSEGTLKVTLAITTMTGNVDILIENQTCQLIQLQNNDKLYLESFYRKPLKPFILLNILQEIGFFIAPKYDDYVYTNIKAKTRSLEENAYKEMALICAEFKTGFIYSRWNSHVEADKIVVQLCLEPSRSSKSLILLTENTTSVLSVSELSQNFSEAPSSTQPICADLSHLVAAIRNSELVDLSTKDKEFFMFVNAVYQMLAATKVFCS